MDKNLLPESIVILGKTVEIKIKKMDENLGEFCSEKMRITIDPKQSNDEAAKTLLHEITHCILHITGLHFLLTEDLEEAIVRALEHALGDLIYFKPQK